jgi:hypothetical protein
LSEAHLQAGQRDRAAEVALKGLTGARLREERGEEAWSLLALADSVQTTERPDMTAAESYCREAMALADELGTRPLVARCHAGLAGLYRRTGRGATSGEHLATAMAMCREMGMTYWLEKTEASGSATTR